MKIKYSNCSTIGKLMIVIGLLVMVPLVILVFYQNEIMYASSFLIPAFISIGLGTLMCLFIPSNEQEGTEWHTSIQRSNLVVLFAWIWGIFIGALPFYLSKQLTLFHSFFESVSGWTTTGLSVMNVVSTPNIFLFHRSFMQYCGGLGFVLVMIVLVSGKHAMSLYNAEGHPDKLMPNIKRTVQTIFMIYNSFLIVGIIAYMLTSMPLFDSIMHAMCALSTGGFSIKLNSIGDYHNIATNIVTICLMFIGTTNFAILLLVFKRKFSQAFKTSEAKFMIIIFLVFVPLTTYILISQNSFSLLENLNQASFGVASALSTTGYSTADYAIWPATAQGILILMMLMGGGTGSTAGGIKMSRIYILLRITILNIKRKIVPAREIDLTFYYKAQGKTIIDGSLVMDTVGFVFSYIIIYVVGSLLITFFAKTSLIAGMFEFASALGTVGLSVGITNVNASASTLIIEMIGMVLGRLEIFIVIIGVHSSISIFKKNILKILKQKRIETNS